MKYYSTRGKTEEISAAQAIMKGLAPDGGLYVPVKLPETTGDYFRKNASYNQLAKRIFNLFLSGYEQLEVNHIVDSAYNDKNFDHSKITPIYKISDHLFFLELWHGPTYAFKDIALQALPFLMQTAVKKCGENAEIVILTATSGDTGKSALEGFRDVPGIKIIIEFPARGVSEVQKLQMITQEGNNVNVAAVEGNFDHAQNGVKQIFSDQDLSVKLAESGYKLSSANSINWGRLLPQIVYYFSAYQQVLEQSGIKEGEKINFVVPTGNFGNILAGYYARKLGLPINKLICAANSNNVLSDFIQSGRYDKRREFYPTLSPSMDILISSNLERLLFELSGHDAEKIGAWMQQLNEVGYYDIDKNILNEIQNIFWSDYADDNETLEEINCCYYKHGYLIDTHSAAGKVVYNKYREKEDDRHISVILSTASPFKFTGSVIKALTDGNRYSNLGELDMMKILAEKTGLEIPANLAELETKAILHKQVIAPDKMYEHLLSVLNCI